MNQALRWLYLVSLVTWIGSIIFFSAIVAPTIFKVLKPEDRGEFLHQLFSKYYLLGMICAVVGIICVGLLVFDRSFGKWPGVATLVLLAIMGAVNLWMRQSVAPQLTELRSQRTAIAAKGEPPSAEVDAEFDSLHRLSVRMNVAVLLSGLVLVFLVVYSRVA